MLQALFFAHGGVTTLGINTLSLAFFGPLATICLWSTISKFGLKSFWGLGAVCAVGGLSVYIFDALILSVALSNEVGITDTFWIVLMGFAPVQIPLVIVEAFVSVKIVQLLQKRRPDLLPSKLHFKKGAPVNVNTALLLVVVLFISGCTYKGIDETVFGATADDFGQPPVDSYFDFSQGEMGLATSILILFGFGFLCGISWERLFSGDNDEA